MSTKTLRLPPLAQARRDQFEQALAELKLLPSTCAVPMKILELKRQPMAGAADFARVISSNPALSAKSLALANSAAFSPMNPVTRLSTAIGMIGLGNLLPLIFGVSFSGIFNKFSLPSEEQSALWRASLLKAVTARECMRKFGGAFESPAALEAATEEAFLAALFQDVALPVFYVADRAQWPEFVGVLDLPPAQRAEREARIFGITHAEAAGRCALALGLPDFFVKALADHHSGPDVLSGRLPAFGAALHVAATLPHRLPAISPKILQALAAALQQNARVSDDAVNGLVKTIAEAYTQTTALFAATDDAGASFKQFLQNLSLEVVNCLQSSINSNAVEINEFKERERDMQRNLVSLQERAAQAEHDSLTGALTRPAFMLQMGKLLNLAQEHGVSCAVGFVDLDNFKRVNDTHGHNVGDQALVELVRTLTESLRGRGIVGRMGGDEFVVALVAGPATIEAELAAFKDKASKFSIPHNDGTLELTTSIGIISVGVPDTKNAPERLIQEADVLMYEAKRAGKGRAATRCENPAPARTPRPQQAPTAGPTDDMALAAEQFELIRAELKAQADGDKDRRSRERRGMPRVGLRVSVTMVVCSGNRPSDPRNVWVRDISSGGIGLLSPEPIAVGTRLLITLPRKTGSRLTVLYTAVRCHPLPGAQFAVGARMERTVDPNASPTAAAASLTRA